MHKKKLISACGVVAIAVVVGAGASYYSQHSAKNEPEVETEAEKPELTKRKQQRCWMIIFLTWNLQKFL